MPRILLVEDDADVRFVLEHGLLDEGYEVDSTQTSNGGKDLLGCRDYDLVIADGRLPDGTGIEVADRAAEKGISSLIVTGYAFIMRELTKDPDRYNVLLKPIRPAELIATVQRILASTD